MPFATFSRRTFLQTTAFSAAAAALAQFQPKRTLAQTPAIQPAGKPLYRFILLGDTHYDLPEHHDMNWVNAKYPKDLSQIKGYIENSQHHTPALLQRVKQIITASTVPIPFVLHVGDLVEGLCGSYDLASRQFHDALQLIEKTNLGVPFLMCKGNHDITGPGAADAYQRVLLPWLSKQADTSLSSAAFSRRYNDDLFILFDSYQPDLDWLEGEFKKHADVRHTFFLIHQPVVPYNARVDWIVYAKKSAFRQRERLLNLLGQRNAIVLSGHLHKYSFLERQTSVGSFSQLAVCSVVRTDHPQPREELAGLQTYTPDLLELEPNFEPATHDAREQCLHDERPNIRRFEYADLPGLAVVNVYSKDVQCDVYPGIDENPYRSESLIVSPV